MEMEHAIEKLCALAQETRLQAFRQLVTAGTEGLAAGALASRLVVPPGTLSFHLKEMTHAGLIQARRQGRQIIYAVNYAGMRDLLTYLMQDCCQGQPELCAVPAKAVQTFAPNPAQGDAR